MTPPPKRWLQRELHWRLMLPVLGIVLASAVLCALGAQFLVDRVFDRWLIGDAHSLAHQVHFDNGNVVATLSAQAEAILTYDEVDLAWYEVRRDGRHLVGREGLPLRGPHERRLPDGTRVYDGEVAGREVRVACVYLADGATQVQVLMSETLNKRRQARRDLLLMLAPVAALVLAATFVIGLVVRRTLQPLERMAARWNEQSQASLEPIQTHGVPTELLPFASALNDLLARVRAMLERERQFAATAAHQLRTPLAGLQLGLARAESAGDLESARGVLRELGRATQRTSRLVQQLLALSRLDPEVGTGLDFTEVDLVELARAVGETCFDAARRKRISLELEERGGPVKVNAQADLLAEAVGNLLDNAIRYTPPGGRVVLAVQDGPPSISVSDSGPGIPPEERTLVLQRFARGRHSDGEGSGLGLAIVQEIAALHGAQLEVGDAALGGTCVRLIFRTGEAPPPTGA